MKAKKSYKKGGKFPDLTGDGKVTRADILKGRGVFKKGGAVEFRSKDRETAKKMLREYFQKSRQILPEERPAAIYVKRYKDWRVYC